MLAMKAAVVERAGAPFQIQDVQLEPPRDDEILVRLVAAGVCHTDMVLRDVAQAPSVFGHEGAAVVLGVGKAVTAVKPGDKVLLSFASCGACRNCLEGSPAYCYDFGPLNMGGVRADGSHQMRSVCGCNIKGNFFGQSSFATHALTTERNVVRLPPDTPDELLHVFAPLGCGIQTGAGAIINSLHPPVGSTIVVFGAGSVGLSAVMAARVSGASQIIAVDLNHERLALATELGATHVLHGADAQLVEQIRSITKGGADFAVETTGNRDVVRKSAEVLRRGGTTGLIGVGTGDISFGHQQVLGGIRIMGILEGDAVPQTFIPKLIDLYRQGRLPLEKIITKYPFEQIQQAVEDSESGVTIKGVLVF